MMADIIFPESSQPGRKPGEGAGRLINARCVVDRSLKWWEACPGLTAFAATGYSGFRGGIEVSGQLYAAVGEKVVKVSTGGVVTVLTGALSGSDPVTFAANNAATPDLVAVCEAGTFSVSSSAVTSFADPDLPAVQSCASLDGYLCFNTGSGNIWATDLNAVTVDALSLARAESSPDGLIRLTSAGRLLYAWGASVCEIWSNAGLSPFPLQRAESLKIGLMSRWAIAGFGAGWDGPQIFVASDGTVRALEGYQSRIVSTADVEASIAAVVVKTDLRASVYVAKGHPIWVLSGPSFTWEFDLKTGLWNERKSFGLTKWRGVGGVYFNGRWYVGDSESQSLLLVDPSANDEAGATFSAVIESAPIKDFPRRIVCHSAYFDFTNGQGVVTGLTSEIVSPTVAIEYSHDGGATWVQHSSNVKIGAAGEYSRTIRLNRFGMATHHGMRFRLTISAPVHRQFRGGRCEIEARAAA